MKSSTFWFILFYYVPLLLLFLFSVYFYYRAIRYTGLQKLKKFTSVMLGVFAGIVVLAFIKYDIFHLLEYIPYSFWGAIENNYLRLALVFGITIYCLYSIKAIRHEKNWRFLVLAWRLIAVFSVAAITWKTYRYFTWKPPVIRPNASFTEKILFEHVMRPRLYMRFISYELCWLILSCISLLKIRKEKRRYY